MDYILRYPLWPNFFQGKAKRQNPRTGSLGTDSYNVAPKLKHIHLIKKI